MTAAEQDQDAPIFTELADRADMLALHSNFRDEQPSETDLPPEAYPRDEPMQNDMAEYREVLEPDLSDDDRARLNSVREEMMSPSCTLQAVVQDGLCFGKQLLLHYADQLHEQCKMPPVGDVHMLGGSTGVSAKKVCVDAINLTFGFVDWLLAWLSTMPEFVNNHAPLVNVFLWIIAVEFAHHSLQWLSWIGLLTMANITRGFTALLLLRCYYALLTCTPSFNPKAILRDLRCRVLQGIRNPARMKPPVLASMLLARTLLLARTVCQSFGGVSLSHWVEHNATNIDL